MGITKVMSPYNSKSAFTSASAKKARAKRQDYSNPGGFRKLKETDPERLKQIIASNQTKVGRNAKGQFTARSKGDPDFAELRIA